MDQNVRVFPSEEYISPWRKCNYSCLHIFHNVVYAQACIYIFKTIHFFSFMILVVFIIIEFVRCQYAYATLTLGFRIRITNKVTSARKVLEFTDLTVFFSQLIITLQQLVLPLYFDWCFFQKHFLHAAMPLWSFYGRTMVSAGLSLFGVAVGIGNIVVGADSDDGRWHLSGGSLVPAILVSHILKRFAIHMVNCPSVLDTFFVSQK